MPEWGFRPSFVAASSSRTSNLGASSGSFQGPTIHSSPTAPKKLEAPGTTSASRSLKIAKDFNGFQWISRWRWVQKTRGPFKTGKPCRFYKKKLICGSLGPMLLVALEDSTSGWSCSETSVGRRKAGKKQKSPVSMIYLGWGYLFQKTEHSSWYLGPFSFIEWPSFDRTSARSADWRSPAGLLWDLEKQPLENGPWRAATCDDTTNKVRFDLILGCI